MNEKEIYTSGEIASFFKVTTATLKNWRKNGNGPKHLLVGGQVRYLGSDVIRYMNESAGIKGNQGPKS